MQNKTNAKKRDDLKVVITATALTLTLAFWNLFSRNMPKPVDAVAPEPPSAMMEQGRILLGGPAPKTTIIIQQSGGSQPRNQQNRPQPVTNTSSSK